MEEINYHYNESWHDIVGYLLEGIVVDGPGVHAAPLHQRFAVLSVFLIIHL